MSATMKAAVYTRYGGPDVIEIKDVLKPIPKDNEVLIRVHATTVAAADWRLRKADPFIVRFMNGVRKPTKHNILGMEFAGIVESVGKTVTQFQAGDPVFGGTGFQLGTHAEYICAPENGTLAIKPANMSFEEARAVFFGGMTALSFLRRTNIQLGQKVLIYGGSGSVGVFAIQLAKVFGAHVTAVCSTANLHLVKALGADEAVDYTRDDFSQAGKVYDVVYDTVGYSGYTRTLRCLKCGGCYAQSGWNGRWSSMLGGMFRGMWVSATGAAKIVSNPVRASAADVSYLKGLIEAGKLRTVIDRCYPLEQIAEAHRYAETGRKKGHAVIVLR